MRYFNTWEAFIKIKDLKTTPKLLLIWIAGYSQKRISFEFTNKQIAENFRICKGTAKAAVKELKDKEYIDIDKPGCPFRKLKWADKAKAIYKIEKQKTDEAKKKNESTGTKNHPVNNSTGMKNIPVTSTKNHPVPVGKTTRSIVISNNSINQPVDFVESDKKSFSGSEPLQKSISAEGIPPNGELFETFWLAYPRRENRAAAKSLWAERKLDNHADEIMAGLDRYNSHCRRDQTDRRYILLPTNWLDGERWTDDLPDAGPAVKPLVRGPDGLTPREAWLNDNG